MQTKTLVKLGGFALIVAGAFYIADTLVDWAAPANRFGIGIGVSLFALMGVSALYLSALRSQGWLGLLGYIFTSMGLTGLAGIALFNNLIRPALAPEVIGDLFAGPVLTYFITTGVLFLIGGLFLAPAVWRSGQLPKISAPIYLLGCIPVALPPVFPAIATELGGLAISAALIIWGVTLMGHMTNPKGA